MLRKISTLVLLVMAASFLFSGCTKTDVISSQDDLTGTWTITGIRSNSSNDWNNDGHFETDIYGTYSYCQRDIVLVFDQNGTGQGRQGCDAPWQGLSWQLLNNNRTLYIGLPDRDINLNNLRVYANTIEGDDDVVVNGRSYIITYTLQRR